MTEYKFDKNTYTLFVKEYGYTSQQDKIKTLNEVLKILQNRNKLKILQDSRFVELSDNIEEIESFAKNVITKISRLNKILYHAAVYNNPAGIASSLVYEEAVKLKNYKHKVFSTIEAAEEWLNPF